MTKAPGWYHDLWARRYDERPLFAVSERDALVSEARTVCSPGVPMSGGAESAGAAKSHD